MYLKDKNIVNYRFWVGEDITINFRTPINQSQYEFLNDYTLSYVATSTPYDFTPRYTATVTANTVDPTTGTISIAGSETADVRDDYIYIRIYGTNKITGQKKQLYNCIVLLLA